MKPAEIRIPKNVYPVGDASSQDVKIYIHQDIYKEIEKLSTDDISVECGSVLIGDYIEDEDGLHIIISDYIEAKYAEADAASLTFTHETWDYIHMRRDRHCPDKRIVGWHHTHPGYGIFLSAYDMFIQQNFFNMPFQTAYVVDPIADTRGFFRWKDGEVSKLSGFYVYDDDNKKPVTVPKIKVKSPSENEITVPKPLLVLGAALLLCTTFLSIFALTMLL